MYKIKKRNITLIEILIVITIITILLGALAYNIPGALEKGKSSSTKISMEKLEDILNMSITENPDLLDRIETEWQEVVKQSPFVKDPNQLIKDGWGFEYDVKVDSETGVVRVRSERYEQYLRKK